MFFKNKIKRYFLFLFFATIILLDLTFSSSFTFVVSTRIKYVLRIYRRHITDRQAHIVRLAYRTSHFLYVKGKITLHTRR